MKKVVKLQGSKSDDVADILDSVPQENKHGDCYVQAFRQFMQDPSRYVLVHGVVTGQGPLEGIEYCHAWVLDGDTVIDRTLDPEMQRLPKALYYYIGQIEITREYDLKAVRKMTAEFGTYGPWDDIFNRYP